MSHKENFISGIYNYCDRWCEKCTLTARCRVFAMEQDDVDQNHDITQEAFWRKLQNVFEQTAQMLRNIADENGIDFDSIDSVKIEEESLRRQENIRHNGLLRLAEDYADRVDTFINRAKPPPATFAEEDQGELLEIITWYRFFISAKIHRGLLAGESEDADGTIKIALIALDRSIMAWFGLLNNESFNEIKPLIALLETIRQKCEEKFPDARSFIRPGFDEIESVM